VLQGYVDDSGSDGQHAPFILAAYILPAEKWAYFSDDWREELNREPRIEYFKMREAAWRDKQFAGIPEEFVKGKINGLLKVIATHGPDGVYTQLDWRDYRDILEPEMPDGPMKHPYQTLFPGIFDAIMFYERRKGVFPEVIDLDFDEQGSLGDFARLCYPFMKAKCSADVQSMLGRTPTMLDDKKVMPLQAADLLAWNLRREFDPDDAEKKWHWLYEELNKRVWLVSRFEPPSLEAAVELVRESRARNQ
jgi:hypothetical protein